jgi:hypothetical protein
MNAIRLYRSPLSGHAHRAELMLAILRPYPTLQVLLWRREISS